MTEESSEPSYVDAEQYSSSGKDKINFKIITLTYIQKILLLFLFELRGGFWQTNPNPNPSLNVPIKIYIEDSREKLSNGIEALRLILSCYFDPEMKKACEKFDKELDKAFKSNTIIKEETRMDQNPEEAPKRDFQDIKDRIFYRDIRVTLSKKLFEELMSFLYRQNYLDLGVLTE